MPYLTLIQTEKSYLVQKHNTYLVSFNDVEFTPTKHQIAAILKKNNLDVEKVTVVNPYRKIKVRHSRSNKVAVKRAKKFYITLKSGQKIAEDLRLEA